MNKHNISTKTKLSIIFLIIFIIVIVLYLFVCSVFFIAVIFAGLGFVSSTIIILIIDLLCFLPVLPQIKLNKKMFTVETVISFIIFIKCFILFLIFVMVKR